MKNNIDNVSITDDTRYILGKPSFEKNPNSKSIHSPCIIQQSNTKMHLVGRMLQICA